MEKLFGIPLALGTPMEDKPCPHCGAILRQIVHTEPNGGVCYVPRHKDCECSGAQAEREADADVWRRYEELQRARRIEQLLRDSGIEDRYRSKTLDNYTIPPGSKKLLSVAAAYTERFHSIRDGTGLFITGSCGIGKTHIANAVALELIRQGHSVICKTSIDLLADIRRTFGAGEQSEFDLLEDYLKAELVIIDDLGKEKVTDWSVSTLYALINMRYMRLKPIIVTTNHTDAQLVYHFSRKGDKHTAEAIGSRLSEACHRVEVAGEDYRKRKG